MKQCQMKMISLLYQLSAVFDWMCFLPIDKEPPVMLIVHNLSVMGKKTCQTLGMVLPLSSNGTSGSLKVAVSGRDVQGSGCSSMVGPSWEEQQWVITNADLLKPQKTFESNSL